jgi:hypothetical protein
MKPLFDLIVRTIMLNTTHAINLVPAGGNERAFSWALWRPCSFPRTRR